MYQAAEDEPNSSSVESGPRAPWFDVRLRRYTVGQISERWPLSNSPTSTLRYSTRHNINQFSLNNINIHLVIQKVTMLNIFAGRDVFGSQGSRQIFVYIIHFFSCGAAAQRGPWPPHS